MIKKGIAPFTLLTWPYKTHSASIDAFLNHQNNDINVYLFKLFIMNNCTILQLD